jgi:DNA helicase-2/ATP-dependent DNA helicase PcrA
MKERILLELAQDNVDAGSIWISTFHKLCLAILRKHGHMIGLSANFSIYSSREQEDLMGKIARMRGYENTSKYAIMHLIKAVNDFREDVIDFEQHIQELSPTEVDIVKEYQETLDELNAIDFSGMLYKSWLLLKNNPVVVESLSKRFKFVLVDEMQDTNRVQYDIVKLISGHDNIFVVGDVQQSIYGFRGAKPENIQRLRKDFNDVNEVTLPRNYRSTSFILEGAQRLIRNNKDATSVELHSDRGTGATIRVSDHMYPEDEAEHLVFQIKSLRQAHGYNWKDFSVLYRMNSLSRAPEMALRANGIPYRILGGFSFFDRMEIKAALSYLTLLVNPRDTINFNRAITHPKRGLGGESVGRLETMCKDGGSIIEASRNSQDVKLTAKARANLKTFVDMVDRYTGKDCKLSEIAEGIIKESGLYNYIQTLPEKTEADKSRLENLDEFIAGIVEYEKRRPKCSLVDYLQSIQLIATGDDEDESEDAVKLLTIHSAKGLEWPCVNIIGAEKGCIPHVRAANEQEVAEERRLMYVAMTRAESHLNIKNV